jgi:hypothetical protein
VSNPVYELLGILVRGGKPAIAAVVRDGVRQAAGELVQALGVEIASSKAPDDSEPKESVDVRRKK